MKTMMTKNMGIATFFVRIALGVTFISAYSGRLNLFGNRPEGWQQFLEYAARVNSYAPDFIQSPLAILATILEVAFSILLIAGFKTRIVAIASGTLTCFFALAMTYSFGIKEPLDYGVFVNFSAAFLLATMPKHQWSLDYLLEVIK